MLCFLFLCDSKAAHPNQAAALVQATGKNAVARSAICRYDKQL
jgi:hypothetical protein